MCQVNKTFVPICNDTVFWMNKLHYDYLDYFNIKPVEISWKQAYLDLSRVIPLLKTSHHN